MTGRLSLIASTSVGNGHDANNHDQRRQRLCLRRCRTRQFGKSSHSRGAFSQSLRGVGAGAPGRSPLLRTIVPGVARGLKLRHDHGSNYMSATFRMKSVPGHRSLASFVREPEGNGVAERFIRTLKENLLWVRVFRYGSRNYAKLSGSSRITITKTGWSLGMAIKRPLKCERSTSVAMQM